MSLSEKKNQSCIIIYNIFLVKGFELLHNTFDLHVYLHINIKSLKLTRDDKKDLQKIAAYKFE